MARLEIPALDETTAAKLVEEAQRRGVSPEELASELLRDGLGVKARRTYHDLDHLAGTWTEEEAREFAEAIAPMEQIDEELWREPRSKAQ